MDNLHLHVAIDKPDTSISPVLFDWVIAGFFYYREKEAMIPIVISQIFLTLLTKSPNLRQLYFHNNESWMSGMAACVAQASNKYHLTITHEDWKPGLGGLLCLRLQILKEKAACHTAY